MRKILLGCFTIVALFLGYQFIAKNTDKSASKNTVVNAKLDDARDIRLVKHVDSIKTFLLKNPEYNPEIAFFIDMKISSGRNRFFIYNLKENKVIDEGLVAHGSGSETGIPGKLHFSNTPNSNSSSLGKYSIGNHYIGKFGKSYTLYGLDKTNSKAYERYIVLHKYKHVPYEEQIDPIVNSLGCPMVNEKYFKRIEKILDTTSKRILLTIYY